MHTGLMQFIFKMKGIRTGYPPTRKDLRFTLYKIDKFNLVKILYFHIPCSFFP